jgi:hypothetical protein
MKITYDTIKENIRIFEDAKLKFPIIQKYINGDLNAKSLYSVGLHQFSQFFDKFIDYNPIIENMTWRKLKPILIENANLPRFKTYIKNRTQNDFNSILKNAETYDKLLNGRWIRKPSKKYTGRRSDEKLSSLTSCSVQIINYIIQNEIEVCDNIFNSQWFTSNKLTLNESLVMEMKVTEDMLKSIDNVIDNSKIDFKKLNLDYISDFINEKLQKLMMIESGKSVRCVKTNIRINSIKTLTEGKDYIVDGSSGIRNGYLNIWIIDDTGQRNSYPFSFFEDISFQRNNILDSLLG